jgi:hypothetical protein
MMTVLTDRSRMVAYRNCPRLRYWNYHYAGTGIVPVGASVALSVGSAFHTVVAQLRSSSEPPADIIASAARALGEELTRSLPAGDDGQPPMFLVQEQVRLLEGLAWAWVRVRLPLIQEEYEPIVIERELLWPMGTYQTPVSTLEAVHGFVPQAVSIVDMVRCDVLERRRADGLLFYREYKTTSSGDEEWAKQFDTSTQILANILAVREALHEDVAGILIEGVIKGSRAKDRNKTSPFLGQRIQQSALCYVYDTPGGVSLEWSRAGRKTPSWTVISARDLVYHILDEAACLQMFSPVPPIIPREEHLQRWRRQAVYQEGEIWRALHDGHDLDEAFPMNDDHCHRYFGNPCAYKDCCFDPVIGGDPLRSGLYLPRTPHHPTELEPPTESEKEKNHVEGER